MKVFRDDDGNIYLTREEIPVIHRSDNSEEIKELSTQIDINEAKYKELQQKTTSQYNYLSKLKLEREHLNNGHNQPTYKPTEQVEMSTLKLLSKLGYKHIVMPDVFLLNNFYLDKNILNIYMSKHEPIIGEVHDKVIVYKRKQMFTSDIYKNGIMTKGRELKWFCTIRTGTKWYAYHELYFDENKIRFGNPGCPMKGQDFKKCLDGLFYIDRSLDYNTTKQMVLTELMKRVLKGD
jgi:hypothetical protein